LPTSGKWSRSGPGPTRYMKAQLSVPKVRPLADKRVNGGNVPTGPVLPMLPVHDGPPLTYAEGIAFKQMPYETKVG